MRREGRGGPLGRGRRFIALGALLFTLAGTADASAGAPLDLPSTAEIQGGAASFTDAVGPVRLTPDRWGGSTIAQSGEALSVYVSDAYPVEPALVQRTADFLAQLYHGPELGGVSVYIAPLAEIKQVCGSGDAAGCYSPAQRLIVAPGSDLPNGVSVETILAHEYGHHVAASRDNAPWPALDWGGKRWASYEGVCARQAAGTAFPGDEGIHYLQNPGEAFAESYRLLNFQRQSWPSWRPAAWNADLGFYPDVGALAAVKADVLDPWEGPALATWHAPIGKQTPFRPPDPGHHKRATALYTATRLLHTPRDGELLVSIDRAPPGTRVSLSLPDGTSIVPPRAGQASYMVCGERQLQVRVTSRIAGEFTTRITTP